MNRFLFCTACLLFSFMVRSQDLRLFEKKEYKNDFGQILPYRILFPENYDRTKKYPLVLFLHGAGERGSDNNAELVHGATLFLADSNRKKFPCIVIFPQCPANNFWNSGKLEFSHSPLQLTFDYVSNPELWPLHSAIALTKEIAEKESVDHSRIYISGLSMGGMGTFEAVYRYPDLFAAAMPICGGGDTTHYDKRVLKTSFWVFHGDADGAVRVEESRNMVNKLKALHANVNYTEYPGVNHNSWDNAFAEPAFLSWMFSQRKAQTPIEDRVNSLLSQMTLEEKIDYIGGVEDMCIRPIERLQLPRIVMSDGPIGVRTYGKSTAYPAGIATAATWDTTLVDQLGRALGRDARARGVHILLAPGVNIYRAPMCGRNFEYFGEDPYLVSRMAVNYIRGVQSEHVVATVKHFAGNNQEWARHTISSDIDERTLQEIYLPAFKAAVTEANVGCVMNSYNLLNGIHATQNAHLNLDILKGDWNFKGALMSDWNSVWDGVATATNGLDLEMPYAKFMNRKNLLPAVKSGILPEELINDKVRRLLRLIISYGFYDHPQKDSTIALDDPANAQIALQLAREGTVLLKNENHVLPLDSRHIKSIAIIGPNGNSYIAGGGSSITDPFHSVNLVQGIQAAAGAAIDVKYIPAAYNFFSYINTSEFYSGNEKGMRAEYFDNLHWEGQPKASRIEKTINHEWESGQPDIASLTGGAYSIRWTGEIKPAQTGKYRLAVRINHDFRLWIDDKLILGEHHTNAPVMRNIDVQLEAGKTYAVRLEYSHDTSYAVMAFAWYKAQPDFTEAIKAAKQSDIAVVSVGFNSDLEQENYDRSFNLPEYQDSLVNAIAAVNPKTIVVLNAGGNVNMQAWLPHVKGLLHAWYPGQEGGTALAEILFGKINPGGKLPVSFEKRWEDAPAYHNYYDEDYDGAVAYKEGLFIGYRYYDTSHVKPQFPFGYGLSYTRFSYSHLKIEKATGSSPRVVVSFDVTNTGNYDGAEVAELYVHQQHCTVQRPYKELKGFSKVFIKKGETKHITIELNEDAFSYYKTAQKHFGYDPGMFDLLIGASSEDIRLKGRVKID